MGGKKDYRMEEEKKKRSCLYCSNNDFTVMKGTEMKKRRNRKEKRDQTKGGNGQKN